MGAFLALANKLQYADQDLQQVLGDVKSITGRIERGKGLLARLLGDGQLIADLERLLTSINTNISRIGLILDELQVTTRNISLTSDHVNDQFKSMPQILRNPEFKACASSKRILHFRLNDQLSTVFSLTRLKTAIGI